MSISFICPANNGSLLDCSRNDVGTLFQGWVDDGKRFMSKNAANGLELYVNSTGSSSSPCTRESPGLSLEDLSMCLGAASSATIYISGSIQGTLTLSMGQTLTFVGVDSAMITGPSDATAIVLQNGSSISIREIQFDHCPYGAIYVMSGSTVLVEDSAFVHCGSPLVGGGGAIAASGPSTVVQVYRVSFERCEANYVGGAIYANNEASVEVTNCTFDACQAAYPNPDTTMDLCDCVVEDDPEEVSVRLPCLLCYSFGYDVLWDVFAGGKGSGGAILVENATLDVESTSFTNCTCPDGMGGAVTVMEESVATFMDCAMHNCSSTQGGGGVYVNNATLTWNRGAVSHCSAESVGGGWLLAQGEQSYTSITGPLMVQYCFTGTPFALLHQFKIPPLYGDGGAILFEFGAGGGMQGPMEFWDNSASGDGGHVALDDSADLVANQVDFVNGRSGRFGGAISCWIDATIVCTSCLFKNGFANHTGGCVALYTGMDDEKATFIDSVFEGCVTEGVGGALYILGPMHVVLNNTVITQSSSIAEGGGIYLSGPGATLEMDDTIISHCFAKYKGAGLYMGGGEGNHTALLLNRVHFDNNTVVGAGGAIAFEALYGGHGVAIHNCNFTHNTALDGDGGAIMVASGCLLRFNLTGSSFVFNRCTGWGGAIALLPNATKLVYVNNVTGYINMLNLSNNSFCHNDGDKDHGEAPNLYPSDTTCSDCLVDDSMTCCQSSSLQVFHRPAVELAMCCTAVDACSTGAYGRCDPPDPEFCTSHWTVEGFNPKQIPHVGGTNITITGVFAANNETARMTVVNNVGIWCIFGDVVVRGWLLSETTARCLAPPSTAYTPEDPNPLISVESVLRFAPPIGPEVVTPSVVPPQNITWSPLPSVEYATENSAPAYMNLTVDIILLGNYFLDTEELSCRFGDDGDAVIVPAEFIEERVVMCPLPRHVASKAAVRVSNDGQLFGETNQYVDYYRTPAELKMVVEPPSIAYSGVGLDPQPVFVLVAADGVPVDARGVVVSAELSPVPIQVTGFSTFGTGNDALVNGTIAFEELAFTINRENGSTPFTFTFKADDLDIPPVVWGTIEMVTCSEQDPLRVLDESTFECVCVEGHSLNYITDECEPCTAGYFSDAPGNGECEECSEYETSTNSSGLLHVLGATSDKQCTCDVGAARVSNTSKCINCTEIGAECVGGDAEPVCSPDTNLEIHAGRYWCDCVPGMEYSDEEMHCVLCPQGTYNDGTGGACKYCPWIGLSDSMEGATSEDNCTCNASVAVALLDGEGGVICTPIPPESDSAGDPWLDPICRGDAKYNRTLNKCQCNPGYELPRIGTICVQCGIGTYRSTYSETDPCISCPLGENSIYQATMDKGSTSIDNCTCPFGTYNDAQEGEPRDCVSCALASASIQMVCPGGDEIPRCPRPAAQVIRDGECQCREGYQLSGSSLECERCPLGTYKGEVGIQKCDVCLTGKTTSALGALSVDECRCAVNYFRAVEDENGLRRYDPTSPDCLACLDGATCAHGGNMPPRAAPGYYVSAVDNGIFLPCSYNTQRCRGNNTCQPGYEGFGCDACAENFFPVSNQCRRCPNQNSLVLWLTLIAIFGLASLLLRVSRNSENDGQFNSSRILLGFVQVTALYVDYAKINWPDIARSVFSFFSFTLFDIDIAGPECSIGSISPMARWVMKVSIPLLMEVAVIIVWVVARFLKKRQEAREDAEPTQRDRSVTAVASDIVRRGDQDAKSINISHVHVLSRALGTLAMALYLPAANIVLQYFDCEKVDDGRLMLVSSPGLVECYQGDHASVLPVAILGVLIFIVAVPLWALWAIARGGAIGRQLRYLRYGFLWARYRKGSITHAWELVTLGRRLMLVVVFVFLARSVVTQVVTASLVLLFAIIAQVQYQPYVHKHHNHLQTMALTTNLVTLLGALLFINEDADQLAVAAYEAIILVLMGINLVTFFALVLREVYDAYLVRQTQSATRSAQMDLHVLSHTIAGDFDDDSTDVMMTEVQGDGGQE